MALINARNGQEAVSLALMAGASAAAMVQRYWASQDDGKADANARKLKSELSSLSVDAQKKLEERL